MKKTSFGAILLFLSMGAFASAKIEFDSSAQGIKSNVEEALSLLPSHYLDKVKKIKVKVKSFDTDKALTSDLCNLGEESIFATANRMTDELTLSAKFVNLANTNTLTFECSHGSFKKELLATIIHELTHFKDDVEDISTESDFERIVGVRHLTKKGSKKLLNHNTKSSPDAYEFKNLKESLAVNTEFLVLDSEFECRRPATATYLSKRLGIPLKGTCHKSYKVITQSAYPEDNYLNATSIDPKRIYQIHYFFAGKGREIMSRWGHAMFRLVICAPFRKQVGPECLGDVSHHVALSYRAFMDGTNLNYSAGLTGKYPSQLFIFRYHEMLQEYNKFELRDIFSVPLKMTEPQKIEFIDLTLERYWTYQGKYYFIDNNCGTESKKHLAVALDEDQAKLIHSVTPYKMYKDMTSSKNNLKDGDIEKLLSKYDDLKTAFEELKKLGLYNEKSIEKFIDHTRAEKRLRSYENFFSTKLESSREKTILMKVMFIERYLATKYTLELPKIAMKKMREDKSLKDEVMKMAESMRLMFTQPWEVVKSSYGAPTLEEFEDQYPKFVTERKELLKSSTEDQMKKLNSILGKPVFKEELAEIESLKKIKDFTNNLIQKVL